MRRKKARCTDWGSNLSLTQAPGGLGELVIHLTISALPQRHVPSNALHSRGVTAGHLKMQCHGVMGELGNGLLGWFEELPGAKAIKHYDAMPHGAEV